MISLWQHGLVVITLLVAHGSTLYFMQRRVRELRGALEMRQTLLGGNSITPGRLALVAGGHLHFGSTILTLLSVDCSRNMALVKIQVAHGL